MSVFECFQKPPKLNEISQFDFSHKLPVLIYDSALIANSAFNQWAEQFNLKLSVESGEGLKSLRYFPDRVEEVFKLTNGASPRDVVFVAAGGGSVGDFVGFLASIYKRGAHLVHVPTTWLAAVDSAHGGKTALNLNGIKNQIGSFYPAAFIMIVKPFLDSLSEKTANEGASELIKMALLEGGSLYQHMLSASGKAAEVFWQTLPQAIQGKYNIVEKDPLEKTGERFKLNLGHTVGHVFESVLELSHGQAVHLGMHFTVNWSAQKFNWDQTKLQQVQMVLDKFLPCEEDIKLSEQQAEDYLMQDKKRDSNLISFVFLQDIGQAVIEKVTVAEIINEMKRQKVLQ